MTRTISTDTLRKKVSGITDEASRDAAAAEARRRWEEMRSTLVDRAEVLSDAAEDQWDQARHAARPKVKRLRKKASKAIDAVEETLDGDRLRAEAAEVSAQLRRNLAGLGLDLRDAAKTEADRIIRAVQDAAEEQREAERKRRVRALVGWTLFGMAAGAILAVQFGPTRGEEAVDAPELGDVEQPEGPAGDQDQAAG